MIIGNYVYFMNGNSIRYGFPVGSDIEKLKKFFNVDSITKELEEYETTKQRT